MSIEEELSATEFAFKPAAITKYNSATGSAKKLIRNEIIDARIRAYDIKFGEFEEGLFSIGVGTGIGTDWATLALSGLTAVTGGEATKAALGAANTALIGAKGSIDKRLLLEKTTPAITAEMVNQRTAVLVDIRTGLSREVIDYNLYQALTDLERYRRAGSLTGGLSGIVKSAGEETKANEEKISEILSGQFQEDDASILLTEFVRPGGTTNSANAARLRRVLNDKLRLSSIPITQFLNTSEFAAFRLKAVEELGLNRE